MKFEKKNSGIHIDHKRNKTCKNEGFLKPSLFQICQVCLILTKMTLKHLPSKTNTLCIKLKMTIHGTDVNWYHALEKLKESTSTTLMFKI